MTAHTTIFETINGQYFQLTNSEKKVADYVLSHRIEAQYMSISELAEECEVADATISRFCRRLGLAGYNAFKLELAKASMTSRTPLQEQAAMSEEGDKDSVEAMCQKVYSESVSALNQTLHLLDRGQLLRAADYIQQARRVVCMGQGGSMVMAEEAWSLFSTISSKFVFIPDSHLQINTMALMEPEEIVLFFSYSGSTRDLQDILEVARERRVKVILVSRFPKSPGGMMADVVLQCGANEGPLQAGSAAARIAQLFVIDLLFTELVERSPEQAIKHREYIAEAVARKHL